MRAEHRGERHRTSDTPWGGVLEIYDRRRYFTISDRGVGAPSDRQRELDRVVDELLPATGKEVNQSGARAAVALDDQELLDRMFASRRGADIRALYEGAGRDASAGDLALCNHLAFWFGGDPERIDRVFRSSGRMRDKWERADYRERTIDRALAGRSDCYAPPRRSRSQPRARPRRWHGGGAVSAAMCVHEGCRRRARICRECVRACSLQWWGAIARHRSETGQRCELCELGEPAVCGEHFLEDLAEHRSQMRELGHRIGEPEPPDVIAILQQGYEQGLKARRREVSR